MVMILTSSIAYAADLGVHGKVFPLAEVNLIDAIYGELGKAQSDGRVDAQLECAVAHPTPARVILVAGTPKPLMDKYKRRFYYDQQGKLSARFGLQHTPGRIMQDKNRLRIEEVVIP